MKIGIHPDNRWGCSFSDRWRAFLEARGVEVVDLDLLGDDPLEQAARCDGVMWRWFHLQQDKQSARVILQVIEETLQIPVFPAVRTSWHFDDKVAQFYLLQGLQAPQPRTWVFWERERALAWAETAPYPVVFKLAVGAGSSSVVRVTGKGEAVSLIERMFRQGVFPMTMNEYRPTLLPRTRRELREKLRRPFDAAAYVAGGGYPRLPDVWWKPEKDYALFQEFLPGNDFDTRVTVIGERAYAFRRFNRPGDFRASGSGSLDHDPRGIDLRCVRLALEVSARAGFQTMAYDFLFRESEPVICEISYTFVDSAVFECPGNWDGELRWHEGRQWPEEAQVEDFLVEVARRKESR